ncbi:MAG: hypothetical protein Dbin4_03118, partial [Alphaproteobacteria bacterium]|nr:hypothetical protein [Alphaproteobacteria bacterium]
GALPYIGAGVAALGILKGLGVIGGGRSVGPNAGAQLIEQGGVFAVGPSGADNGGNTAGVIAEVGQAVEVLNALAQGIGVAQIGDGIASFIDTFKAGGIGNAADLIKDAISKGVIEGLTEAERALISSSSDIGATASRIIENRLLPGQLAAQRLQIEDPGQFARNAAKAERDGMIARLAEVENGTQALADAEFIYQDQLKKITAQFATDLGDTLGDTLSQALEVANLRAAAANDNVNLASRVLQKAVEAERKAVTDRFNASIKTSQAALDGLRASAQRLTGIAALLKNAIPDIPGQEGPNRASAQAMLSAALAAARAGGALPDEDALRTALDAVAKPSEQLFSTFVDYQRDFIRTANDIQNLSDVADWQRQKADLGVQVATDALEQDRLAYEAEIARLDGILTSAQEQIDAVNGTTVAVVSVEQAVRDLIEALSKALAAGSAARSADPVGSAFTKLLGRAPDTAGRTHFEGALASGQSKLDVIQNIIRSNEFIDVNQSGGVAGLYRSLLGREADPEGLAFFNSALAQGQSLQKIALDITRNQEFLDNLPGFAHGGF